MSRLLFIDNFDSFTYNLVDEFYCLGHELSVVRNNIDFDKMKQIALEHDLVVLSPGPGEPKQAGHCLQLIKDLRGQRPFMGICLGHQCMVEASGEQIVQAEVPVHGKVSLIHHHQTFCFSEFETPLSVGRYHSLYAQNCPDGFKCLAYVDDILMSIYHQQDRLLGFQFHPESVLTTLGSQLLKNATQLLLGNEQ